MSSGKRCERVLITGANRGLGYAFVEQYAARSDRVFAACRDPQSAHALNLLARQYPDEIAVVGIDVTDPGNIDRATTQISADGEGHLDILVNNAGVSPRGERFGNLAPESMQAVYAVNTIAPVMLAQSLHPLMCRSHAPRIANISSSMGSLAKKGYGRHYSYASSKAALNMLTRASAHDLRDDGIVVVSLHPGWVRTDLGGPHAAQSAEESIAGMIHVIDQLSLEDTSQFFTWKGEQHPW